jgi:hypothetical protein
MNTELAPIRERAAHIRETPRLVSDTLEEGADRAAAVAERTMEAVKSRMGFAE